VGINQLNELRQYIRNQVQHHQKVTLEDELNKLIEENNLDKFRD
jgi:hypothetical protein